MTVHHYTDIPIENMKTKKIFIHRGKVICSFNHIAIENTCYNREEFEIFNS